MKETTNKLTPDSSINLTLTLEMTLDDIQYIRDFMDTARGDFGIISANLQIGQNEIDISSW